MRPQGIASYVRGNPRTTLAKEGAMKLSNPHHFHRLAGASLVLAPLLLLASSAVSPALKSDEGAQLTRLNATPGSALPLQLSGFAFLLGTTVLAIGLYRARTVPTWIAPALEVGIVANLAGFLASSVALLIASSAVLLAALGWVGAILLTNSDAHREHTPELAR